MIDLSIYTALEAIGSFLVLGGLIGVRYKSRVGPAMMMVGGAVLALWAISIGAWFVLGLNAGAAAINAWTLWQWTKEEDNG